MTRYFSCIAALLVLSSHLALAQVVPQEGSTLSGVLVGFFDPSFSGPADAVLEVAMGSYKDLTSFRRANSTKAQYSAKGTVVTLPAFDKDYTWRLVSAGDSKLSARLHHFSVAGVPAYARDVQVRIDKPLPSSAQSYFFLDCTRGLYNTNGEPVWFVPEHIVPGGVVENLTFTSSGTITFLHRFRFYEISYGGRLYRRIPARDSMDQILEGVHHDAVKLNNGHVVAIGNEVAYVGVKDAQIVADPVFSAGLERTNLETIREFDGDGKVLWEFSLMPWLRKTRLNEWQMADGKPRVGVHVNAFCFDEQREFLYVGCRDINSILKVAYPSGKVVSVIKGAAGFSEPRAPASLFCEQHALRSRGKEIYVFNNNGCRREQGAQLVILEQPDSQNANAIKVWEYGLEQTPRQGKNRGGNVELIGDRQFFISAGMPWNELLLIDRDKDIRWRAFIERAGRAGIAEPFGTYRASFIPQGRPVQELISVFQ